MLMLLHVLRLMFHHLSALLPSTVLHHWINHVELSTLIHPAHSANITPTGATPTPPAKTFTFVIPTLRNRLQCHCSLLCCIIKLLSELYPDFL